MIILIFLLMLICTISIVQWSGGGIEKFIYIKKSNTNNRIATAHIILDKLKNLDYNKKFIYNNIIRDYLAHMEQPFEYYIETLNDKANSTEYDYGIDLRESVEIMHDIHNMYDKGGWDLTTEKTNIKLCPYKMPKRELLDKKCDKNTIMSAIAFNWILNNSSPGNQWTLVSNAHMDKLIKYGFKVECFGSSYNTRMPWFGSISPLDKPWGRIGTYDEIIETLTNRIPLKWNNTLIYGPDDTFLITINPPSFLCKEFLLDMINKLFENRKGTAYIDITNRDAELVGKFKSSPWCKRHNLLKYAWSMWTGEKKDMTNREWINFIFSNEDEKMWSRY